MRFDGVLTKGLLASLASVALIGASASVVGCSNGASDGGVSASAKATVSSSAPATASATGSAASTSSAAGTAAASAPPKETAAAAGGEAIPLTEYPPNRVSDGAVIAPIAADCKKPLLILGSSMSQEFNFLRAVLWAHPEYRIVPEGTASKEGDVEFKQLEFMGGYTPVARCSDAKTCEYLGRAFQAVVRSMKARTACDDPKTPGDLIAIDIDPRGAKAQSLIASDYRAKCARLGACMVKADPKIPGDPALSCQAGPNNFKVDCAWAASCADVMACVEGKIPMPTSP
jgi:hypothetical protein